MCIEQVLTEYPGCILTPSQKHLLNPGVGVGKHGLPKTLSLFPSP